jgi:hypothetical protein
MYLQFVSQCSEFCRHNPLSCFSANVYCRKHIFPYRLSPETFGYASYSGTIVVAAFGKDAVRIPAGLLVSFTEGSRVFSRVLLT